MALFVVIILPLVIYEVVETRNLYQVRVRDTLADMGRVGEVIALEHENLIASGRDVLVALGQIEAVRTGEIADCSELLTRVSRQFDKYTVFSRVNTEGFIVCSSTPIEKPIDVSKAVNIQTALTTKKFALSRFIVGPISGKPVLVFTLPMLDADGRLLALVNTGLNLDWLEDFIGRMGVNPEMSVLVFDGQGILLAAHNQPGLKIGDALADNPIIGAALADGPPATEVVQADGTTFLVSFSRVKGIPGELHIAVAKPREAALADLESATTRRIVLVACLIAFFIAGAWTAVHRLVVRWVNVLSQQAGRLADGDFTARTGARKADSDMGLLATNFDRMAEQLEARDRSLRVSEQTTRALLDAQRDSALLLDADGVVLLLNRIAAGRLEMTQEQVVGRNFFDMLPEDLAQEPRVWFQEVLESGREQHREEERDGRHYALTIYPVSDEDGRVGRVAWYTRDITEYRQAEKALRDSEQRLEMALKGADLGLWDWDMKSDGVVINERWAEMLGYTLEELPPWMDTWRKLVHPDDLDGVRRALKDHLDGKTPLYESEHRLRAKDGEWLWVLDRGRVTARDEDGKPLRVTGTHLDVTARKRANEELIESRANLEKSQDIARLANWVWEIASGRMGWSSTIYRMLEANPGDLGDSYEVFLGLVHPRDRNKVRRAVASTVFEEASLDLEFAIQKPHGGVVIVHGMAEVVFDDQGEPVRVVGTLQDITERRRAEDRLRESEARIRAILDTAVDGIVTIDTDGIIETCNRAAERLFGYRAEEIVGRNVAILMPEPHRSRHDQYLRNYLETRVKKVIGTGREVEGLHKDGSRVPIELAVSEVDLGRRTLFTALIRDISPRKEAERELRIKESAIQSSINAIALADLNGGITYVNKAWAGMWGLDEQRPGQSGRLWDLFGQNGPGIDREVREKHEWFGEIEVKPKSGRTVAVQLSANMVTDVDDAPICFMASLVDVTARKKAEEQLKQQATIDSLTGLLNRREFMERLEADFKAAKRHDLPLCVAMCDLDHFKKVNDTYGHRVGDDVLRGFALLLKTAIRTEDTAGRYGGEEFVISLPHTGLERALRMLERIRAQVAELPIHSGAGGNFSVTASFGVAQLQPVDAIEMDLVERADRALYQAKSQGRNQVVAADR